MKISHYLNGEFVTEEELLISPRDLGFTRGYAVFDFFRTYNGHKPFMLDSHIDRFFSSSKKIGLVLPWTKKEVKNIIINTLEKNDKNKEFAVRIIVSGGTSKSLAPTSLPTFMVILDELIYFPKSIYENGIKVLTVNHKRYNPYSKTIHYIEAIKHMQKINDEGFGEILYVYDDSVLEGAYSNFFCVVNNKLVTAKHDVLPGITRQVIINKLNIKIPVEVRDLKVQELATAKEAFISVSSKGIVPVIKIDNKSIGNGKVGPVTKEIINKFDKFIESGKW